MQEQPGQNIVMYGCGQLAKTLLEHNLVDEFRFWVYPVVRGKGTRLFEDGVAADLELVETRVFGGGFVVLMCRPKAAAQPPAGLSGVTRRERRRSLVRVSAWL